MLRTLVVEKGELRAYEGYDEARRILAHAPSAWLDSEGDDPELPAFLAEALRLHPMAIEDILEPQPVPKVEDYGDYLYVVAHGIRRGGEPRALVTAEVDLVIAARWVFTHHHASVAIHAACADVAKRPRIVERGSAFLAHAVLDRMVDEYMPVVDAVDDELETLEDALVESPGRDVLARIFDLKRVLQRFRRTAVYQRELLHRLARGDYALLAGEATPFYRDVYDHFVHVADLAESYREQLTSALDVYLSASSNRLNEVIKTLTIVATVFMPMTFVVGVYGMNFDGMPELHWRHGYAAVWVVLLVIPAAMLLWFRSRRWT